MQRWGRFPERVYASIQPKAVWLRGKPARTAFVLMAAWVSVGCESGSFMPPVNPELSGEAGVAPVGVADSSLPPTVSATAPEPARPVEVILAAHEPGEAEYWSAAARMQAGLDRTTFKISILNAESPKEKQAELVREALAHHPRALVVEPADPGERHLAQAILAARGQGIPVVLVGRGLADVKPASGSHDIATPKSSASQESQAPIVVIEPKFADSAKQIVAATIRLAKASELEPAGGAAVVFDDASDAFRVRRLLAITDALKAAGISTVEDVQFTSDTKEAEKLLKERLKAHPKIVMLFGVDAASASAIREVMNAQDAARLMIAGCYTTEDQVANVSRMPQFAAVAEFTPTRVLRKAISTAVGLAQGKSIPPALDYRISVLESPINASALKARFATPSKSAAPKPKGTD